MPRVKSRVVIIALILCLLQICALGEGLPSFSRSTPAPTSDGGLPSFSRDIVKPTAQPTITPTVKPAPVTDSRIVIDQDGYRLEITDILFKYYSDVEMRIALDFTNTSGKTVSVRFDEVIIDGDSYQSSHMMWYDRNDSIVSDFSSDYSYSGAFIDVNADTEMEILGILNAKSISFTLDISDENYRELVTKSVSIDNPAALSKTPDRWGANIVSDSYGLKLMDSDEFKISVTGARIEYDDYPAGTTSVCARLCLLLSGSSSLDGGFYVELSAVKINGTDFFCDDRLYIKDGTGESEIVIYGFDDDVNIIRNLDMLEFILTVEDSDSRLYRYSDIYLSAYTLDSAGTGKTYEYLQDGDSGYSVENLQSQLIGLGYLFEAPDGNYGENTGNAVRDFCEANGIKKTTRANLKVQEEMYSISPVTYSEPSMTLEFTKESIVNYYKLDGDKLKFRVKKIHNFSKNRTIKAFELRAYAEDVWGQEIYDGSYYYNTTTVNIAPDGNAKSEYMIIPNRSDINLLYIGISRVVYSDGTVAEADTVNYWYWDFSNGF